MEFSGNIHGDAFRGNYEEYDGLLGVTVGWHREGTCPGFALGELPEARRAIGKDLSGERLVNASGYYALCPRK